MLRTASPVEFHDATGEASIDSSPAQIKHRLETQQSNTTRLTPLNPERKFHFGFTRENTPVGQMEVGFFDGDGSARMNDVMAFFADGNAFAAIFIVHGNSMLEDLFPIAVEFPQSEDDVVQIDDVVNLKLVGGTAAYA